MDLCTGPLARASRLSADALSYGWPHGQLCELPTHPSTRHPLGNDGKRADAPQEAARCLTQGANARRWCQPAQKETRFCLWALSHLAFGRQQAVLAPVYVEAVPMHIDGSVMNSWQQDVGSRFAEVRSPLPVEHGHRRRQQPVERRGVVGLQPSDGPNTGSHHLRAQRLGMGAHVALEGHARGAVPNFEVGDPPVFDQFEIPSQPALQLVHAQLRASCGVGDRARSGQRLVSSQLPFATGMDRCIADRRPVKLSYSFRLARVVRLSICLLHSSH